MNTETWLICLFFVCLLGCAFELNKPIAPQYGLRLLQDEEVLVIREETDIVTRC